MAVKTAEIGIEENHDKDGRKLWQYGAALIASISTFCTGTTLAWTSQIGSALLDGELGFKINEEELGWIGSFMPLGAAVLSVMSGPISDKIGRKIYMISLSIPMLVGWLLLIFAQNVEMLYIGRFFTGMVAGAYCMITPLYTSEISQKEIRGRLGSFTQMMISIGVLFTTIISNYLSIVAFTSICGTIPIIFAISFISMPESPTYLIKRGYEKEARNALVRLRGTNYNVDHEIDSIKLHLKELSESKVTLASFKTMAAKRACIMVFGLMLFRVWCAVDCVTVYAALIFEKAKVSVDEHISTILIAVIQTITSIFQSFVIEKLGRKFLSLVSSFAMAVCLGVVAIMLMLSSNDSSNAYKIVPVIALCVFYIGYALGLGPIPWLICGEVFPQDIKSFASSVANCLSWLFTFSALKVFLIMLDSSLNMSGTFLVFSGITFLGFAYIKMFVHETKNKSLSEIQDELNQPWFN